MSSKETAKMSAGTKTQGIFPADQEEQLPRDSVLRGGHYQKEQVTGGVWSGLFLEELVQGGEKEKRDLGVTRRKCVGAVQLCSLCPGATPGRRP